MTSRTLMALAAALVVLVLLVVVGQREAPPDTDRPLLSELGDALGEIDRVIVVGAGARPVATLEQGTESWVVAEKDRYPADVAKIREVLVGLAEARIIEQKTSNPEYYDRLGVEPVEAEDASGVAVRAYAGDRALPTVIVGDAAGGDHRYVRLAESEASYMVDRALDVPRNGADWLDRTLIDLSAADVREVTIEHPDGETVRISKQTREQSNFTIEDIPEGREPSYAGVANVIGSALSALQLDDVEAAPTSAGDAEPVRTTYRTFDGLVVTVTGAERDGGAWISLQAAVDPSVAADSAAPAEGAAAEGAEEAAEHGAAQPGEAAQSALDIEAQAERINTRVGGWRYKIPAYKLDQMTRRMSDLLKTPPADDE